MTFINQIMHAFKANELLTLSHVTYQLDPKNQITKIMHNNVSKSSYLSAYLQNGNYHPAVVKIGDQSKNGKY